MTQILRLATRVSSSPFRLRLLALACLLSAFSPTQAHDILVDGNPQNDWIEGLVDNENVPCCGNNDCYPLAANALQISSAGVFSVEIGGSWFEVPERGLLRDMSPDGRPWVCPKQVPTASGYVYVVRGVRCLLLPMGA
jgi:hypothetical protein